jgi:hypothetical protein
VREGPPEAMQQQRRAVGHHPRPSPPVRHRPPHRSPGTHPGKTRAAAKRYAPGGPRGTHLLGRHPSAGCPAAAWRDGT